MYIIGEICLSVFKFVVLKISIVQNDLMTRWFTALLGTHSLPLSIAVYIIDRKSIYLCAHTVTVKSKDRLFRLLLNIIIII